MISTIFPRQREMNDETDSSVLYLRASSSLLDTSTTVLNENCHRNSWAKSSHVRRLENSRDANRRWAAPLRDRGKIVIIWGSSSPWALITVLYSRRWMRGQSIPVYLSISGILNLADKLATGIPSKSSQTAAPSNTFLLLEHSSKCPSPSGSQNHYFASTTARLRVTHGHLR